MELDVSRAPVNDDRGVSRVRVNNDRGVRVDHNVAAALVRSRVNIGYAPKYCDKHRSHVSQNEAFHVVFLSRS